MAKFEETEIGKKFASPIKAIRAFCGTCIGGGLQKVKDCTDEDCELYAYREGKNPFRKKREMSDEQKEAAAERMKKMHAARKKASSKKKPAKKATKKKK